MDFDLNVLKELYRENKNLMAHMRDQSGSLGNTAEQIMLSYDFQAGSYIERYNKDPAWSEHFLARLTQIIDRLSLSGAVLEAGVGEATSLVPLLKSLPKNRFNEVYAFDISWSRIKAGKQFSMDQNIHGIQFFTGELQNIPIIDDYFDLVYTVHAIEPNGGREKEILQELYRVCRRYLILLEPCYEFASNEARERMVKNGYITHLADAAKELKYHVETYELYGAFSNELNPTGLMIIKKSDEETKGLHSPYACPISKKPMARFESSFYCQDSMLAYPIIQSIPCLLPSNAVVATQYLNGLGE